MEKVIVIRDVGQALSSPLGRCVCVDTILLHANPDCPYCQGDGEVRNVAITGKAEQRMSEADFSFENALTIWDDEDEVPISDILAYFKPDEDVVIGDRVVHRGKRYQVISVQKVMGINNDLFLMCSLERVSE